MEASVILFLFIVGLSIYLAFKHYESLDSVVKFQVAIASMVVLAVLSFLLFFAGSRFLSEILMLLSVGISVYTFVSIKIIESEPEPEEEQAEVADNLQDRIDKMLENSKK
jgi:Ca2+/Na+ antiporter